MLTLRGGGGGGVWLFFGGVVFCLVFEVFKIMVAQFAMVAGRFRP